MNPFIIFKNPIIRAIGVGLVLYFALFYKKDNPESLGNRFSSENIRDNIKQINQKGSSIVNGIALAKNQEATLKRGGLLNNINSVDQVNQNSQVDQDSNAKLGVEIKPIEVKPLVGDHIITTDREIGHGADLSCGKVAEISYKIILKNSKQEIQSVDLEKILIGSGVNPLIENKIVGMKQGGVREIEVFQSFKTEDKKLAALLEQNSDLIYTVHLISVSAANQNEIKNVKCY